jgi:hypothetical protein
VDVDAGLRASRRPLADTRLRANARGRNGGVREELATRRWQTPRRRLHNLRQRRGRAGVVGQEEPPRFLPALTRRAGTAHHDRLLTFASSSASSPISLRSCSSAVKQNLILARSSLIASEIFGIAILSIKSITACMSSSVTPILRLRSSDEPPELAPPLARPRRNDEPLQPHDSLAQLHDFGVEIGEFAHRRLSRSRRKLRIWASSSVMRAKRLPPPTRVSLPTSKRSGFVGSRSDRTQVKSTSI